MQESLEVLQLDEAHLLLDNLIAVAVDVFVGLVEDSIEAGLVAAVVVVVVWAVPVAEFWDDLDLAAADFDFVANLFLGVLVADRHLQFLQGLSPCFCFL